MNRFLKYFSVACCALVLGFPHVNLGAQTADSVQTPAVRARIRGPIVDADRVVVEGNVHPLARPGNDQGVVADGTRIDRMVLVLQPSAAQQADLDALTAAQQDPESLLYHQWLTPEEFGNRFGVSASDLAQITRWLQAHGFAVEPVPAGRN